MDARSVVECWRAFEKHDFEVCIDGGWAVDALLGRQTRRHADLDIALPYRQTERLRRFLTDWGFRNHPRDDTWECNFVMKDEAGREVDVHSYVLDATGKNVGGVPYMADHLTGEGSILGVAVRCIAPEWLVRFHTGYELDQNDFRDVSALCRHFGIPLPEEYKRFLALN